MALIDLLGPKLVGKGGTELDTASALASKKYVFLYFSASWCGPCKVFTPTLAEFYKKHAASKSFEIVFISADNNDRAFKSYFSKMPWLARPYEEDIFSAPIAKKFGLVGIPTIVLLDADGNLVSRDARNNVDGDPEAAEFPWIKSMRQVVADLDIQVVLPGSAREVPLMDVVGGKIFALAMLQRETSKYEKFCEQLEKIYKKLKAAGKNFEVVVLPVVFDDGEEGVEECKAHAEGAPWPVAAAASVSAGMKLYEAVEAMQSVEELCVCLFDENGELLTADGYHFAYLDPEGSLFPWRGEAPVREFSVQGAKTPAVLVMGPGDEAAAAWAAARAAAEACRRPPRCALPARPSRPAQSGACPGASLIAADGLHPPSDHSPQPLAAALGVPSPRCLVFLQDDDTLFARALDGPGDITADAIRSFYGDVQAGKVARVPPKPPGICRAVGTEFVGADGDAVAAGPFLDGRSFLLLYFASRGSEESAGKVAEFYRKNAEGKSFQAVLVPVEEDGAGREALRGALRLPFPALRCGGDEGGARVHDLCKMFGVAEAPALVVVSTQGKPVTRTALVEVTDRDPEGARFPWRPTPFLDLLAELKLEASVPGSGAAAPISDLIRGKTFGVAIAGPASRHVDKFKARLAKVYGKRKAAGTNFEVVFLPEGECGAAEYDALVAGMPWPCVPRSGAGECRRLLESLEAAQWTPTPYFALFDEEGATLTPFGAHWLQADPEGDKFPWKGFPVMEYVDGRSLRHPAALLVMAPGEAAAAAWRAAVDVDPQVQGVQFLAADSADPGPKKLAEKHAIRSPVALVFWVGDAVYARELGKAGELGVPAILSLIQDVKAGKVEPVFGKRHEHHACGGGCGHHGH
eukprot:tig00021312_g20043.t1